jgi:hypothetical protein
MRTFLLVALASAAFVSGASAQSFLVDPQSGIRTQADVYGQSRQAPSEISKLCGVDYAIGDPDPNIRLELRRQCVSGVDGGGE